ncbi:uncharacterized protein B0H18DRAFT_1117487 [Fomitopsis serialis]|uniref:uncharacterized protein n=1 Tax=Fomitopsis serialis TaxID=139415 RepID=UPI002007F395|nr:uncharacterized protein B0H18DRAFT_1117487 [Neoantrodia serialis]KAH9929458.1 hypothetical protein B0H18DRAFT_1117487 [Neoantrodia serialis]
MASKTNILLFGGSGYIGGTLLDRLLKHPKASTFDIVTPARDPEKAEVLRKLGAKPEIAALSDFDKIEALASRADVIFNLANADNVPQMNAVLKGIRKRHAATGKPPVLIHTTGLGEIKSIPAAALHRNVDLVVIGADEEGYARSYLISPGIVYGLASAPAHDAGIAKKFSIQIPGLAKAALARKRAGIVGPGKAVWPHAHVDDVADIYVNLFDAIAKDPQSVGHGWEGYYFVENGEVAWYDVGKAMARRSSSRLLGLTGRGQLRRDDMRAKAERARTIGWKPKHADILGTIKAEVELQWAVAQKNGGEVDFTFERGLAKLFGFA